MVLVHFIEHSGVGHDAPAAEGQSVMQAAVNNGVPGIIAECGGSLSCATCHGYIAEAWVSRVPPPSEDESGMIDCALHVQPNSRLLCQVKLTPDLDGIEIHLPASQT